MESLANDKVTERYLYRVRVPNGGAYYVAEIGQREAAEVVAIQLDKQGKDIGNISTYTVEYIDTIIV